MGQFLKAFAKNESGATAIEYGLIAAGIAVAIATIVTTLGTDISAKFKEVDGYLK
jgi:pilus assembly protein Flp/PilA